MKKKNTIREFKAELVRVIDGDTIVVNIDLGFNIFIIQRCRLLGIDSPEIVGESKERGKEVKKEVEDILKTSVGPLIIKTHSSKKDKYGRFLAEVAYVDSLGSKVNLNEYLVELGFAVPYGSPVKK